MAQSSRKQSTSSTDPESLILQGKDVKEKKQTKKSKKTSSKSKKTKSTKSKPTKPTKPTKRQHASRKSRRPHATLTILSTLLLALASAAGIAFAVLATAVLHLQVAGDVPSRIAVFGSSAVSVGLVVVQTVALCSSPRTLLGDCLLLTRLVLLAWIAAVVLTSLEVANTVKNTSISGTLAAQAVYLNLLLSSVGLIATGILSFCLERATRKGKQNQEADDDADDLLDRSVSQRGSVISEKDSVDEEAAEAVAEQEPRPKKLLFSYKATTQLMDDTPASRRASMLAVPAPAPQQEVTEAPTLRPSTSIKRKPVQSVAADRRKSVMPTVSSVQMFSDPFADPLPVDNPFSDSNRIDAKRVSARASRRLSRMPIQALPKLNTAVAPVAATSTFYLDSSGSSNYDNEEEQEAEAKESDKDVPVTAPRASLLPYSPAVTRPLSIVPPMPQVSVPKVPLPLPDPVTAPAPIGAPAVAATPPQMTVPRRKPVGSAPAGPIKRKPVPSMIATKAIPKTETQTAEPLSPMSQPVPPMPTLLLPVSIPLSTQPTIPILASPSPTAQLFGSAVSSRKSSNASDMSDMESSPPSLADMVASSLRRVSVAPSSAREMDLPSAVSKAFGAAPLPTRSVAYAQPRVLDQPIVRKSFIATSGGGGGDNSNSRRPSEVSIMETIYSPAEGDSGNESESERSEDNKEEDDELAAMVRQEAEAAAAAADAGRRWLEPSRDSVSMRDSVSREPQRVERTLSVSKHLSKKPSLSPVEEKEQESTDESEDEEEEEEETVEEESVEDESVEDSADENPAVHTIVIHEPAGFTATGLSRTASRMRKAALAAAKQAAATEMAAPSTSTYIPAYTRRRLSATNNYNFSRPMRSDSVSGNTNTNTARNSIAANRMSIMSTMSSGTAAMAAKRASLVPPVPQTSLLVSPRSRVRRQLLQMLPMQHRPATLVAVAKSARTKIVAKPVRPKASPRKGRQSLSGRRRRRSLSIDLTSARASDSDADLSSASSASSYRSSRSPRSSTSRSSSLAKTAQRARRRNHARGHLGGLRSSTLRPSPSNRKRLSALSGGSSPYTPYTPHNRPISPMTLLMERAK